MNRDIHGYYIVNKKKFYSKVQALIYASELLLQLRATFVETNIDKLISRQSLVKWYFNNEVFESYNWTVEPQQSIDTLYNKRAKYLREKYDYLVVYYSGGSDSHNMVMSFLNQGLKIDELVIHHVNHGMSLLRTNNIALTNPALQPLSETKFQIIPRLKDILIIDPSIKIKMFDTTQKTIDTFSNLQSGDWVLKVREELNPVDSAKYNFTCFDEFRHVIDTNRSVGILVGLDKPLLKPHHDAIYLVFTDRRYNINLFYSDIEHYSNAQVEFFYSSPDACDLICKQAHLVKKWVIKCIQFLSQKNSLDIYNNPFFRVFYEEKIRDILYPFTWRQDWFQAKKSVLDWHSEADLWFHEFFDSTSLQGSCWRDGINFIQNNIEKNFLESYRNANDYDGFKIFENSYMLEKI